METLTSFSIKLKYYYHRYILCNQQYPIPVINRRDTSFDKSQYAMPRSLGTAERKSLASRKHTI